MSAAAKKKPLPPLVEKKGGKAAYGLGHGFAKALKKGVNQSIKARHLEQGREPAWWARLPARA